MMIWWRSRQACSISSWSTPIFLFTLFSPVSQAQRKPIQPILLTPYARIPSYGHLQLRSLLGWPWDKLSVSYSSLVPNTKHGSNWVGSNYSRVFRPTLRLRWTVKWYYIVMDSASDFWIWQRRKDTLQCDQLWDYQIGPGDQPYGVNKSFKWQTGLALYSILFRTDQSNTQRHYSINPLLLPRSQEFGFRECTPIMLLIVTICFRQRVQ